MSDVSFPSTALVEHKCTYLATARLGQILDNVDLLRRRERANDFAHLEDKFLGQLSIVVFVIVELAGRGVRFLVNRDREMEHTA